MLNFESVSECQAQKNLFSMFTDPINSKGIYSSFRNRNFWLEYSTPPTTKFPDYDDYYYNYGSTSQTTTPDPGPRFKESMANHTLVQAPIGSTAFLHCKVEDLRDFQVSLLNLESENCISIYSASAKALLSLTIRTRFMKVTISNNMALKQIQG